MNAMPQADSNPVYAKNLMILSAVVAGKAVLSVAIFTIVRDIMVTDIIASCILVAAITLLVRGGVLRSSREMEIGDSSHPLEDVVSALKAMAVPLAGCLVCQCSLGIGWAAMLFGRLSVVLQTPESFYCVIVGALLCALCLVAARGHIKNIVNFHYYAILSCLLLLVVPWVGADLSGEAQVISTATPWGFSESLLSVIVIVNLVGVGRRTFYVTGLIVIALNVLAWFASGACLVLFGDEVANVLWRSSLIVLIALSALEILRDYRLLEKRLDETSSRKVTDEQLVGYRLTNREKEVLLFLVQGRRAAWIAQKLYISDNTARAHVKHIYQKLGVHSREELLDFIESLK